MFILPIIKDNPVRRVPVILISLIVVNTALLAITYIGHTPSEVFRVWGYTPAHPTWVTLFTSMFLHAGIWHLLGNMWFLWMFGNMIENALGRVWFLLSYLVCGIGAVGLFYLSDAHSVVPLVGASGAISGIAGLFVVLFPRQRFELNFYLGWWNVYETDTRATGAVGAWIGEQIVLALLTSVVHFSSTAFAAHVGGFLTGVLIGVVARVTVFPRSIRETKNEQLWYYRDGLMTDEDSKITELKL